MRCLQPKPCAESPSNASTTVDMSTRPISTPSTKMVAHKPLAMHDLGLRTPGDYTADSHYHVHSTEPAWTRASPIRSDGCGQQMVLDHVGQPTASAGLISAFEDALQADVCARDLGDDATAAITEFTGAVWAAARQQLRSPAARIIHYG